MYNKNLIHGLSFAAPLGYVSNFKVVSYSSASIDVEWSPIVGATEYKLSWSTGLRTYAHLNVVLVMFSRVIKPFIVSCASVCLQAAANLSPVTWTTTFSPTESKA